jgi:hypothetical protein
LAAKNKAQALPPFVNVIKAMLKEPAWLDLSYGARCLYLTVKSHFLGKNNGNFYLGVRLAARELGASASQTHKWFLELQDHGFIRKTKGGYLGVDGEGVSTYWRLTEIGYLGQRPTKDFKDWQPAQQTETRTDNQDKPLRISGRGGTENRGDRTDNQDGFGPIQPSDRTDNPHISKLPGRGGVSAQDKSGSLADIPAFLDRRPLGRSSKLS